MPHSYVTWLMSITSNSIHASWNKFQHDLTS